MGKLYVYSTLTAPQLYQNHSQASGNDIPAPITVDGHEGVYIAGGHGLADKHFMTAHGAVITEVSESQLEYLEHNKVFQVHKKNGFIEVAASKEDPEKVAAEMEGRDASAPLVPADLPPDMQPNGTALTAAPAKAPKAKRG